MGASKLSGKPDEMLGATCDGLASHPGGVAILLVASCYRSRVIINSINLDKPGECKGKLLAFAHPTSNLSYRSLPDHLNTC